MKRLIVLACLTGFISANAQNVGIGTTNPTEKLDVNGNVKISGYLNLNGNTGVAGQVLTSQGTNPPTWTTPEGNTSPDFAPTNYSEASSELFTGDIILKSSAVADKWYDGVGLVSFGDTMFVFGGWYTSAGTGSIFTDQIRYSVDDGVTWILSENVLPFAGHTFVYFKAPDGWLYIIGSDNFAVQNIETVWRTKDMHNFDVMTTTAGWGTRSLMAGWADENSNIYIAGGQTTTNVSTGPNDVWMSTDAGVNWTKIADSIQVNGEYFLGQNICNQIKYFNKRVYLVGGGISAAAPYNTYSKKVFSASIYDLSSWKRENDLPYTHGRSYASVEVWDGKLWLWSGNNAAEGNVRTVCYMDNSGAWHDFKYTYIKNNPDSVITPSHASGIAVHKNMLYRVMGNLNNDAYAIKRSSYVANMNIRDTISTKNIFVSSMKGPGTRLATVSPQGELLAGNLTEADLLTASSDLSGKAISNQIVSAQAAANLWISGRGLFGGGADLGNTLQVNGNSYVSGLSGIGTATPSNYLANMPGLAIYNTQNAGISLANANKYWLTWISNNDLKFFEGGAAIDRMTLKAGGVININNLSGSGIRMVVADATGNLATQAIPTGEIITGANLGNATFGLYKQKVGTELQFRSITTATDGGIELLSNANDVLIKNNAFAAYGKVEAITGDATAEVLIKTITPADNSAGTLEVDMAAVSSGMASFTGKKYARYKKSGNVITIVSVTDVAGSVADGSISSASFTVTGGSGNLQVKVTGAAATTIKWRAVYKLNQVTIP
jgi:hypothetical protein